MKTDLPFHFFLNGKYSFPWTTRLCKVRESYSIYFTCKTRVKTAVLTRRFFCTLVSLKCVCVCDCQCERKTSPYFCHLQKIWKTKRASARCFINKLACAVLSSCTDSRLVFHFTRRNKTRRHNYFDRVQSQSTNWKDVQKALFN